MIGLNLAGVSRQTCRYGRFMLARRYSNERTEQEAVHAEKDEDSDINEKIFAYLSLDDLSGINGYCEELSKGKKSLPVSSLGRIVGLVDKVEGPILASPFALTALEHAGKRQELMRVKDFSALLWRLRFIPDPYIKKIYVKSLYDYIERYDDVKVDKPLLKQQVRYNSVFSQLASRNYELAIEELSDMISSGIGVSGLLDHTLHVLCLELGGSEECVSLLRQLQEKNASFELKHSTWLILIERSLKDGYYEGVRFVWDNYIAKLMNTVDGKTISIALLIRILESAGAFHDSVLVEEISVLISRNEGLDEVGEGSERVIVSSIMNGLVSTGDVERVLSICDLFVKNDYQVEYRDILGVGDLLIDKFGRKEPISVISQTVELLKLSEHSEKVKRLAMNALLDQFSSSWSASGVMHAFRTFMNEGICTPDVDTFRLLINSGYRLGNSKKLTYTIYDEMTSKYSITPTRAILETILKCQMVGRDYNSIFYFLREMRKHKLALRTHIHHYIVKQFDKLDDERVRNIFSSKNIDEQLNMYNEFLPDSLLEKSSSRRTRQYRRYSHIRDVLNTNSYISGWSEKDLPEMRQS